jgi:hypothetical protein
LEEEEKNSSEPLKEFCQRQQQASEILKAF